MKKRLQECQRILAGPGGLALLLVAGAALLVHRLHEPATFHLDDGASIQMAAYGWADVLRVHTLESHPPGHTLMLKAWLALGGVLGIPAHVFWARGIAIAVWLGWAAFSWFAFRRFFGPGTGAAVAWAACLNPNLIEMCGNIRMYGVGIPLVCAAFTALMLAEREAGSKSEARWLAAAGALSFAAFLTHYFAYIVLGLGTVAWLAVSTARRGWRSRHAARGLAVLGIAFVATLPWLANLPGQSQYFGGLGADWRTPARTRYLARLFLVDYPLGTYPLGAGGWSIPAGRAAALATATLVAGPLVLLALRRKATGGGAFLAGAGVAAGIAIAFALATYIPTKLGVMHLFQSTRYATFGAPFWAAALVLLAAAAGARAGRRWLAAVPASVLVAMSLAQAAATPEARRATALAARVQPHLAEFTPPGSPIYLGPATNRPYLEGIFAEWEVRPFAALARHPEHEDEAFVLFLAAWPRFSSTRDWALSDALHAEGAEAHLLGGRHYQATELFHLRGVDAASLRAGAAAALAQPLEPVLPPREEWRFGLEPPAQASP